MAEHPEGAAKGQGKRRRRLIVGALIAVLLIVVGAVLMRTILHREARQPQQTVAEVGVVRLQELVAAHPDYDKLQALLKRREEIRSSLDGRLAVPLTVQSPEVDRQPFDDSVWQKSAQDVIGRRSALERAQKKAAADYRKATEPDYKARRDAINAEYLNEILNLKLKLDNRQAMGLTDETVAQLEAQLQDVEGERAARQIALYRAWQQEIQSNAEKSVAKERAGQEAGLGDLHARREAEAARAQSEAQARDAEMISKRMVDSAQRQQQAQADQQALAANEQAITALESRILSDIAGKAAKVAILHHFTLIACDPARSLSSLLPAAFRPAAAPDRPEKYVKTISVSAEDVTDEVKAELADIPPGSDASTSSET